MHEICSYYIKTIYFHTIIEQDASFWSKDDATLFKFMVKKFYDFILEKRIPYFWYKSSNLIENVTTERLNEFKNKLKKLNDVLENEAPEMCRQVARYLLTDTEYSQYYEQQLYNNITYTRE